MSELDFQEKQIAKNDETIGLLQMAVEKGLDTDKLEKLIALRNGELLGSRKKILMPISPRCKQNSRLSSNKSR